MEEALDLSFDRLLMMMMMMMMMMISYTQEGNELFYHCSYIVYFLKDFNVDTKTKEVNQGNTCIFIVPAGTLRLP